MAGSRISSTAFSQPAARGASSRLPVLRLPGEALAEDVPAELGGQPGRQGRLAGGDRPLDELHDAHRHAVPECPEDGPERGRRLALARPGVDDEQPFLAVRLGQLPILDLLLPGLRSL
jgi:hypothetical protein